MSDLILDNPTLHLILSINIMAGFTLLAVGMLLWSKSIKAWSMWFGIDLLITVDIPYFCATGSWRGGEKSDYKGRQWVQLPFEIFMIANFWWVVCISKVGESLHKRIASLHRATCQGGRECAMM